MANAVVNRQVNVYINSGEAQKAYDALIKKEKILNEELAKTTDPKRIKQIGAEIDKLKEPIERASKKLKGDLAPGIRDLQQSIRRMVNEFERTGDPALLKKIQGLTAQLKQQKDLLNGMNDANNKITSKGIFSAAFWANLASSAIVKVTSLISNFFGGVVQEALDADEATRRLESTLDNLGRGDAFDRISRKSDELARQFRYLDNDDVVAVFNKLIDYGKLTEKQMNDLLPVIIDFAAKSKISIGESADVIVKALEGNGKALKQYGINIKDAGTETERLTTIHEVLGEKVKGAGEAFQNSAKGGIATARQELNNLKEDIGNIVIPALNTLLRWVVQAAQGFKFLANDIADLFSGRGWGATNRTAAEDAGEMEAARGFLKEFMDSIKDIESITEKISLIEGKIKNEEGLLGGLIKNFGATSAAAESTEKFIKLLKDELEVLKQFEKPLGITPFNDVVPKTKEVEKEIKKLKTAWENLLEIQKLSREEVEAWGAVTEKTMHKQERTVREMVEIMSRLTGGAIGTLNGMGDNRIKDINNRMQQEQWAEEEAALQRKLDLINQIASALNTALTIGDTFFQAITNRENAELEKDKRWNDRKRANLENRLKAGVITQLQYNKEVDRMTREQEKKEASIRKKQFEREKTIAIAQVLVNQGEGIAKTIAKHGFPAAIPALLVQAAIIASQIALINSQQPKFAAGGLLGGRSHANGGNAVVDGHGRKIAEVEHKEAIVNKHTMADKRSYTVTGTPGQIISRLNGMYGVNWEGGATLIPNWRNYSPPRMNYTAMRKMYAAGGTFNGSDGQSGSTLAQTDPMIMELLQVL